MKGINNYGANKAEETKQLFQMSSRKQEFFEVAKLMRNKQDVHTSKSSKAVPYMKFY